MAFIDHLIKVALLPQNDLSVSALALSRLSLLDLITCGVAGASEPLAVKLRRLAEEEGGAEVSSVMGGGRAPARMAALVNGATGHALDYDDTHFAHVGHLSVGIYPAALAVGEERGAGASEVIVAFLVGAEAAVRIGIMLGRAHYNVGFHQTATAGAFGATLAAGRLSGLSASQLRNALGLCATRASGLKSQFGTMGKPYNAGIAAANGVECARLASFGMTSADDGLLGKQGFVPTHTPEPEAGWIEPAPGTFFFEDNKYKLHACCHGLHAMIEALAGSEPLKGQALNSITKLTLRTNSRWLSVCDIKRPRTGLETKFSYNWLAGMTIRGDPTGNDRIYTDNLATDGDLSAFANNIEVVGDEDLTDLEAAGVVELADGTKVAIYHNLAARLPEEVLARKLRTKAVALLGRKGERIWDCLARLDDMSARDLGDLFRS